MKRLILIILAVLLTFPVLAEQVKERCIAHGDGTVTDPETGLMCSSAVPCVRLWERPNLVP
ncbi:hypothetical protein ACFL27_00995 [candidate division CSSED10-310 bacterium]|uniref:Uncharacterized protein n=1 Tax=candidate division CSSED10-310 bacterium TaxID=2855610 RepID=A0ABV6YRC8_UNCC1